MQSEARTRARCDSRSTGGDVKKCEMPYWCGVWGDCVSNGKLDEGLLFGCECR